VNSNQSTSSTVDHVDKEWRFQDVQLAQYYIGHSIQIGWDLTSDSGLEFGGWTLDDVCVVANPESICGDGIVSPTEECDDGSANADVPNACRTYCRRPRCGDLIVDGGEQCDDGPNGSPSCTSHCESIADDSSGCATAPNAGWLALAFVALFSGSRARRPSRRRCDPSAASAAPRPAASRLDRRCRPR
jgi:cysteine-rich repeat protein